MKWLGIEVHQRQLLFFLKLVKIILGSWITVTLSSGCSEGMRSDSLTSLVSEGFTFYRAGYLELEVDMLPVRFCAFYYWKMPYFPATGRE